MTKQERIIERLAELTEEAEEVTITRDRYGYRIGGTSYRRVTTMLKGIPKPWLGSWAAKMVAEFAVEHRSKWEELPPTDAIKLLKGSPWSKRDDAGDRGSAIHATIEAHVLGRPDPEGLTEDEAACASRAKDFLAARDSLVLASELTVYNPTLGYAGTLDLWDVDVYGDLAILDWKSSSDVYAEHAVQQIAYSHAEFAVVRKKAVEGKKETWTGKAIPWGPHMAQQLGIVHVTPEAATLHVIRPEHDERLWTVFKASAFLKEFLSDVDSYAGKTPKIDLYEDPINLENDNDEN